MRTYKECDEVLVGRCKEKRKVGNNTWLKRINDTTIGLKYHSTYVVTYKSDGTVILDTCGWHTSTTKERLNNYSMFHIYQKDSIWYISVNNKTIEFFDGIEIKNGKVLNMPIDKIDKEQLNKKIVKYSRLVADCLPLESPSAGDCFYCQMNTESGESLGDAIGDTSHLFLHMSERYVVPSLVYRALEEFRVGDFIKASVWKVNYKDVKPGAKIDVGKFVKDRVASSIRRYLRKRFGLAF